MRVVGLDVSRTVAEIAYLEDGQVKPGGRVELVQAVLTRWAATQLRATDHVVLEATGNTTAVINAVRAHVARVVVANPFQVRLIAEARVKTGKIDAAVFAQLYASGFLPEVWIPDDATQTLRRQVARRAQIVRQRVRLKNEVHSVLHTYSFRGVRPPISLAARDAAGSPSNRYRWKNGWGSSSASGNSIDLVRI
jgi:transposase